MKLNRREFLAFSAKLAALTGLSSTAIPQIAEGLEQLVSQTAPILWIQAQSCSGCSVSLLNSENPGPAELLTQYISLKFHSTLTTATGHVAMDILDTSVKNGGYILVVEGSIPEKMPEACIMGKKLITHQIAQAAKNANAVIAAGTCAAFGGIPAAEGNPTGAVSLGNFLAHENIKTPVITLPGCPVHPDWIVGTLVHVLKFGMPPLMKKGGQKRFFPNWSTNNAPGFGIMKEKILQKPFQMTVACSSWGAPVPVPMPTVPRDIGTAAPIHAFMPVHPALVVHRKNLP